MKRYQLADGVHRVRVGSLVIDQAGVETDDPGLARVLDEHPGLTARTSKPSSSAGAKRRRKPAAAQAAAEKAGEAS